MLNYLFDGNDGWDIEKEPGWWKKKVPEYAEQIEWACRKCGCQLPLRPRVSSDTIDDVSQSNLDRLVATGSPKIKRSEYELFTEGLDLSQTRSVDWYWDHKGKIVALLKRLRSRLLGSK